MPAATDRREFAWMIARRGAIILLLCGLVWAYGTAAEIFSPEKLQIRGGDPVPEFSLPDARDPKARISMSQYAKRGLLINFTATQCKPCQDEQTALTQVFERYGGDHFALLSISSETPEIVKSYVKYHGLKWDVAVDRRSLVRAKMGIESVPTSIFVGPDGKVSGIVRGGLHDPQLSQAVERLVLLARQSQKN